jgi:hydroxyquinol 1,2-dioxygenase
VRAYHGRPRFFHLPMQNLDENTITAAVLARLANTPDARLKLVLTSLVTHLHDFAREVELSEDEWLTAVKFLTETGQISGPRRQEMILLSDTLGLSMLVTAQNHRKPADCTEATVFGPFHVEDAPHFPPGADISNGAVGQPCFVDVLIKARDGSAIGGAVAEVWQSDADGKYDVQYPDHEHRGRGVLKSDANGRIHFKSVLAEAYPIPADGPVGRMLEATARHPWRPAHLHFRITAPGFERLVTHVFRDDDQYLDSDVVFGVRSSLLARWQRHEAGEAPDANLIDTPFYTLQFTFVLNPEPESHA